MLAFVQRSNTNMSKDDILLSVYRHILFYVQVIVLVW